MNELDVKYKYLRIGLRNQGVNIAENVIKFHPPNKKRHNETCVFCNSTAKITKEHVLPKWFFEHKVHLTMISSVNKQTLSYNKAVIPTCEKCNNSILSHIETSIIKIFRNIEKGKAYDHDDLCNVIRWLEILDYKLQVNECLKKYIKYGNSEYNQFLGQFSIAAVRHFYEMNPYKAYHLIRRSQKRITIKRKLKRLNSLVLFNTTKPTFYFFNLVDEYIFLSFPMMKISLFYFFKKTFENEECASVEALRIIDKVTKLE